VRTLGRAIESILAQDYADYDILVVDGGSTDGSRELAASYPGTRVVQQTGRGIADAYNLGIAETSQPLIAFLSSDDEWSLDKLSVQVKVLVSSGAMYSLGRIRCRLEEGMEIPAGFRTELLEGDHQGTMETLLARREVFDLIGPFDTSFVTGEDLDWFARARDAGVPEAQVNRVLLTKYVHDSNASLTDSASNSALIRLLWSSVQRKRSRG
jgi:glycosyltransferase involved in cell wall biosynthesis